jgi:selenocysteine-specific translation elongation factor
MPVLNIAALGSHDLCRSLGKLSDSRDVESFVFKEGSGPDRRILSLVRPLNFPERIRPLLSALNVSDYGIIEVSSIDAALGEAMVAFSASGIEDGDLIINPKEGAWIDPDDVGMIKDQAGLSSWKVHYETPDMNEYRSHLLDKVRLQASSGEPLVSIDQHFVVKGIGLVGIGYVRSGELKKHDSVAIFPGGHTGIVRSLQVMDDDVDRALTGDRVGIALRGMGDDALEKGSQVVKDGSDILSRAKRSRLQLEISIFQKKQPKTGDVVHMSFDLQFFVGRIESIEGGTMVVEWDRPINLRTTFDKPPLLVQLDAGQMRILGAVSRIVSI